MEYDLDGSDSRFADYYFAICHCSPDDESGINKYREKLRTEFPAMGASVGRHFVLQGEPAWRALAAYYQALEAADTLSDDFRVYARERLDALTKIHRDSQSLPVPINLTEGQLASDPCLEFLTCIALGNGQVFLKET